MSKRSSGLVCQICKDVFSDDSDALDKNPRVPRIFDQRPEWRQALTESGCVEVDISDLATTYFTIPWHWKCFGLGIGINEHGPFVTGVGLPSSLPQDPHECTLIGDRDRMLAKSKRDVHQTVSPKSATDQPHHCVYLIHQRCYALSLRVLGADLVEEYPVAFAEAAKQVWDSYIAHLIARFRFHKYDDEFEWKKMGRKKGRYYDLVLDDEAAIIAKYSRGWRCDDRVFALRDPLKVDEVWHSIRAGERAFREASQRERAITLGLPCPATRRRSRRLRPAFGLEIPCEIILEILDYFPTSPGSLLAKTLHSGLYD
ncbi:uncharacterized protein DSM5745_03635 [Aspergillus mulundensis]|uniref:Uncharacterized protein n=1 Tax=Aspergillus mulundensis TaxID=1810919 RepID=A0A3D8SL11_9EURO|nr:hypothetical protein DSM5745_03635 [Aspergillus mulundensis]RDW86993.1 hypothetical protein DSM5745_03635 [Aspergillus mulundensis]